MAAYSSLVLALLAGAGMSSVLAQTAPAPAVAPGPVAQQAPAGQGGFMAFKDPVTGALRPPEPGEAAALRALIPVPAQPPAPALQRPMAAGGYSVLLDSSFDSFMVMTRRQDGSLAYDCLTPQEAAAAGKTEVAKAPATAMKRPLPARPEMPDVQ